MSKGSHWRKKTNFKKYKQNFDDIDWRPVVKFKLVKTHVGPSGIKEFEVGILPDNQPEAIMGRVYAKNKKEAIQKVANLARLKADEDWFAREVKNGLTY